jgi:hypothetical protein
MYAVPSPDRIIGAHEIIHRGIPKMMTRAAAESQGVATSSDARAGRAGRTSQRSYAPASHQSSASVPQAPATMAAANPPASSRDHHARGGQSNHTPPEASLHRTTTGKAGVGDHSPPSTASA